MSARRIDVFFYGLFMDSDLLCLNSRLNELLAA